MAHCYHIAVPGGTDTGRACRRKSHIESGMRLFEGPRIGEDKVSAVALLLAMSEASSIGSALYLYVQRPTSALHEVPEERVLDMIKSADDKLAQIAPDKRERYADELEALCISMFCSGVEHVPLRSVRIPMHIIRSSLDAWTGTFQHDGKTRTWVSWRAVTEWLSPCRQGSLACLCCSVQS